MEQKSVFIDNKDFEKYVLAVYVLFKNYHYSCFQVSRNFTEYIGAYRIMYILLSGQDFN